MGHKLSVWKQIEVIYYVRREMYKSHKWAIKIIAGAKRDSPPAYLHKALSHF
jgi:hypothetical protein